MAATLPPTAAALALLDVQAVASILGISTRSVYRLRDDGEMPASLRLGALVRWSQKSIEEWIAAGCKPIRSAGRARG